MWWIAAAQEVGGVMQAESINKIEKAKLGVQREQAKLEGSAYSLELRKNYNRAMASDAVIGAAQMRRGGSVEAIASASENQFNWDMDFAKISTEMKLKGVDWDIKASDFKKDVNQGTAIMNGIIGSYTGYQKQSENKSLLAPTKTKD